MFGVVQPGQHVALRLPNDQVKVEQIPPNTVISLGKYGSFHSSQIIGRPYHLTFDILDRSEQKDGRELRIVRASEIHAETLLEEAEPDLAEDTSTSTPTAGQFDEYGLPNTADKTNVNILDDPNNQKLTYLEIEALKSGESATAPKELIAKIMANHSTLDQKTAFSLAKYTLRKQKKYMKRFTVLPLDVANLTDWMMNEKDFAKTMEIRNETIGLIGSWANVHAAGAVAQDEKPRSRYLVVDDTGGLLVAAIAERMGILHHQTQALTSNEDAPNTLQSEPLGQAKKIRHEHNPATSNTITLIHANQQPNLSLLRYFAFDPTQSPSPGDANPHPLHTHLHTLSWLQLLQPWHDATYAQEPPEKSPEDLAALKSNHRSNYYRKRRRWQRAKEAVDNTQAGGFDALIIASFTNPVTICKELVPLLAGGAQVVVYNPHIEPLMEVCDVYSTARRTAYLTEMKRRQENEADVEAEAQAKDAREEWATAGEAIHTGQDLLGMEVEMEDHDHDQAHGTQPLPDESQNRDKEQSGRKEDSRFPVDPTLLLTPIVHHSFAKPWQVLPGRTHPMMMAKGGAQGGYVLVSTRVVPVQGMVVQARGRPGRSKKRQPLDEQVEGSNREEEEVDRAAKREKVEVAEEEVEEDKANGL